MSKLRTRLLAASALAAAITVPAGALAQDIPEAEGDLSESAWDVPGQIVVDADDDLDTSEIASLAGDFGLSFTPTDLEPRTRIQIADVPVSRMADVLARLSKDGRVQHAEPLAYVKATFSVDDPLLKDQWHMDRIGAPRAWDFSTGRGVTVAVVDTGIACEDHGPFTKGTDLARTDCVGGWNFVKNDEHANDDQGHGTHVAGTIAQSTNNGIGAAGVAFHARLMPVKVLNENGWGTTADVADGIRWAADNGAHVVNLSLGGPRNAKVLQDAIDHALSRGTVVVAAAGNTGGRVQYPGASEGVIGVSATDSNDKLAKFSSRGDGVDMAAPGVNVVQQTVCEKGRNKCEIYPGYSGTSMASPHVAGAAALLVGLGVTDPPAVEIALRAAARKVDDSDAGKKLFGAGILDASAAVQRTTMMHAGLRLLALIAITVGIGITAMRGKRRMASTMSPGYWFAALAAGPGLLFFLPWLLPRVYLPVDVLARPIADMDIYIGASLHRWLPLANAAIPFAATLVFFGSKTLRPLVAGLAAGTAAYLVSIAILGESFGPLGSVAMTAWCGVNAVLCALVARLNLVED